MKEYQNLVKRVLEMGVRQENRTGVDTITVPGEMMRFDLSEGFPAVTTKKLAFKSLIGELCAFLRASHSAKDFRELGSKVWDANANHPGKEGSPNAWLTNPFRKGEDDLGPVYGVQWREWPGYKVIEVPLLSAPEEEKARYRAIAEKLVKEGWTLKDVIHGETTQETTIDYHPQEAVFYKAIDQLGECIRTIIKNPANRRILFHAWNPAVLDEVALPACHLLYQFLPHINTKKLNMVVYLRSSDVGLGVPFNQAQAAALQSPVARLTGYDVGTLTVFMADCHIYVDQIAYLEEQLTMEPFLAPKLVISDRVWSFPENPASDRLDYLANKAIAVLKLVEPNDFVLEGYQYHELKTERPKMAV